ncbi:transposase [Chryseobacterium lactis]|uniref:Transposase n=2 Tax=Chryseobacterium lactis TaxID=1241981 RepID=A0A3G6RL39_CHRLC|nr:transposase [Chryseobacterium lactis]AZA83292.1 transposase [Chryseobacterium lactis]AZB03677.1 transposase [Chryseobacterium lactis]PNW11189.1 transposase [Chryseobacterium lactis]
MNFKNIHIGTFIKQKVLESEMKISRICNFFKCTEEEIEVMYEAQSLDTEILLRWSKLLKYDFFRIYTQHLIVHASLSACMGNKKSPEGPLLQPSFRKNIYTQEIIEFILELIETGEKDKYQIIKEYRIPKTTLHKWISRNKK